MAKKQKESIIDINEAISNAYVHLYPRHVDEKALGETAAFFQEEAKKRRQSAKGQAVKQLLNSTLVKINGNPVNLETFQKVFGADQIEEALGTALSQAADKINAEFAQINSGSLTDAVKQINSIIYRSGQVDENRFNEWTKAIGQAIDTVNLFPEGFNLANVLENSKNSPTIMNLSAEEAKAADNIIKYILNAKQKSESGELSKGSLIGTTRNIIGSQLGEIWGKQNYQALDIKNYESEIDKAIEHIFEAKLSGTSKTVESGITAKPDVITNKLFTSEILSKELFGNKDYTVTGQVEILANTSVKQSSVANLKNIRLVSGTPILTVIEGIAKNGKRYEYGTYNVLAHYSRFNETYNDLKEFIAGSFMNQYLMGTGQQLTGGGIDTAWFMMISGKVYSMLDIVDDIVKGNSMITIEFPKISAMPKQNKSQSILANAYDRSDKTKELINKLTITAILNANFYKKVDFKRKI